MNPVVFIFGLAVGAICISLGIRDIARGDARGLRFHAITCAVVVAILIFGTLHGSWGRL